MVKIAAKSCAKIPKSTDHKRKLSEAGKGHIPTEATRKRLSESHLGKPSWNKGKQHTDEVKLKIKQSCKGMQVSLNHKWINNGIIQTHVHIDYLDDYLQNGWQLGRKLSI